MAISSVSFQGNGESVVPAAPPRTKAKKLLLSIFIDTFLLLLNNEISLKFLHSVGGPQHYL
jgi:hypothetical protein